MTSVMGRLAFLVLAAATKFVPNVDKVWGWGVFTHDVVLGSWVVLFVLMAIYVLGLFRFANGAFAGMAGKAHSNIATDIAVERSTACMSMIRLPPA
jgi:hypothetical protein